MKKILVLILCLFTVSSQAGILIEPQVGYIFSHKFKGTVNVKLGAASGSTYVDGSGTALEYGGRLGFQTWGFMTGLTYNKGSSDKGTNMGVFAGYELPILLRFWAAYNFKSKVNYSTVNTEGKSIELGVGFTALPLLSLNLIYRKYDLDKLTQTGITYDADGMEPTELVFGVSAPFNLL